MKDRLKNSLVDVVKTLKLVSVEPYLFFCFFGYTVCQVTFQNLLMDSACRNWHLYPDEICNELDDHKYYQESSIEVGNNLYAGVMLVSCIPAMIVATFLGPWSDKYSRKYPLLIAASGMLVEGCMNATLSCYPTVSPVWYVMAAVFSGLSGALLTANSAAYSYISDVTQESSRSARYAVLEFSTICAVVLGSSLGGAIFKAGGYVPVMMVGPCSFGLAILYTALVVKDTKSRPRGVQCSDMLRDLVTVQNIKESYKTCSKKRPGNIRLQIWLLVWISCSHRFVEMGTLAIGYPFARAMYSWSVAEFSQANTAFYVVSAFVTVAVVPVLANHLRIHEAALGFIGMLSLTAKMVVTSVAYSEPFFYYAWMSGSLNNCAGIAVRSRLSKLVNKEELGRAFALLGTCESVTPLLGTLIFVQIYNASAGIFPGLVFASSAVFLVPCVFLFSWMISLPTVSVGGYDDTSDNYATMREFEPTSREETC